MSQTLPCPMTTAGFPDREQRQELRSGFDGLSARWPPEIHLAGETFDMLEIDLAVPLGELCPDVAVEPP